MSDERITCPVCPHGCLLAPGATGRCRARRHIVKDGKGIIVPINYGTVTSLALDPIEKKPLARFRPGSFILSVGSYGCNLGCPFCQNHEISMKGEEDYPVNGPLADADNYLSPEELARIADNTQNRGNIGVAFTYNEPLIGYEYVLDTAKLLRDRGLKTVLVTNGCVNEYVADKVLPYTDALNIDLKSFNEDVYRDTLCGSLETVKAFIRKANEQCHVELTTLIVPGMNDSEDEIRRIAQWIASLPMGDSIPLHVTRFFPRYKYSDGQPTDVKLVYRLADIAGQYLKYVYPGNV
ncbi:MAG: AmmeMemoRadiSam system radical SAM enzyme [Lachnospiraceae bacterium]|nr:AmmeMemoRadiSam system radical SAM enzyme [Lachnospiraceae bacterium]